MIDPLLPGKKVLAIIGFCDIHRFNFIVRRLGSDVRECSRPGPFRVSAAG
jgi:hypothetical protein